MDAKDVIGMTPLHHSLSMHSNDISFEIAKARRAADWAHGLERGETGGCAIR